MRWALWDRLRRRRSVEHVGVIPEHESAVRRLVADAHGQSYEALRSLDEARGEADAVVVMEGDYGGSIYLTCPVRHVHCDEATLRLLLRDLDEHDWKDPEGTRLYYERAPVGAGIAGGTGGGVVTDGVWLHPDLASLGLGPRVESVIAGERKRII
jgi:hypothetical protein